MTTAAMPVYSPETSEGVPGLLVAVVGKDVLVSQLEQDDKDFKTVFDRIIKRTATCRKIELRPCQFQVLHALVLAVSRSCQMYGTLLPYQ